MDSAATSSLPRRIQRLAAWNILPSRTFYDVSCPEVFSRATWRLVAWPTVEISLSDSDSAEPSERRSQGEPGPFHSVAATCHLDLRLSLPVLIEEMDNAMDEAYGAAPERLYLIGVDGRVAYRGGAGPHFFNLDEWERAIAASVSSATV